MVVTNIRSGWRYLSRNLLLLLGLLPVWRQHFGKAEQKHFGNDKRNSSSYHSSSLFQTYNVSLTGQKLISNFFQRIYVNFLSISPLLKYSYWHFASRFPPLPTTKSQFPFQILVSALIGALTQKKDELNCPLKGPQWPFMSDCVKSCLINWTRASRWKVAKYWVEIIKPLVESGPGPEGYSTRFSDRYSYPSRKILLLDRVVE